MTDNVTEFPGAYYGKVNPKAVLEAALEADLKEVMVLAWDQENLLYAAASSDTPGDCLLMMEQFKHALLDGMYDTTS
jgi:hypothetical protein